MPIAGHDRVPLARSILEPAPPSESVRAVLGVAGAVFGLDHAETVGAHTGEGVGVMLHWAMVGRGSDVVTSGGRCDQCGLEVEPVGQLVCSV